MEKLPTVASSCFNGTFNLTVYSESFKCSKIEFNVSTCLALQTRAEIETIEALCDAADNIWITGFWFSVISGIIGNALAILTIASLPRSTSTFFVGLLATSDLIGVCILAIVHLLDKYRMYSRATDYWDMFPMCFDMVASYSNWLLVFICLERYFTIRFPLHKRYYFTLRHAKISAIFLAIAIFTVYNSATWTLGYGNMNMYTIRNLFYTALPLGCILVTIAFISCQLRRIHQDRRTLRGYDHSRSNTPVLEEVPSSGSGSRRCSSTPLQEIARLENSMTVMMLVAAVCFSIFTIPNCVLLYTYRQSAIHWNTPTLRARWYLFHKMCQVLSFLNLSVNFVLYFLSAKKFRAQLFRVISRRTVPLSRNRSQQTQHLNNNSKTENSHHLVYVDVVVCDTSLHRDKQVTPGNKGKQATTRLTSLPECSHVDSSKSLDTLQHGSNGSPNSYV